jgi:hypothetical protein
MRGESQSADRYAASIVGGSAIAALVVAVVDKATASFRSSGTLAAVTRRIQAFEMLPRAEQVRSLVVVVVAALAGHIVMALMLPPRGRPIAALTAALFLAAIAAAVAATARSR